MGHHYGALGTVGGVHQHFALFVRDRAVAPQERGSTHLQMPSSNHGQSSVHQAIAQRPLESNELPVGRERGNGRSFYSELLVSSRRHWKTVAVVWAGITVCSALYAVALVPSYDSTGILQVSSRDSGAAGNPLTQMLMDSGSEVETEVEILRRRELLLSAAHDIKLGVTDEEQAEKISTDIDVTLFGKSPINPKLAAIRDALEYARVPERANNGVALRVRVTGESTLDIDVFNGDEIAETLQGRVGEGLETQNLKLKFKRRPLGVGESMKVWVEHDERLMETIREGLHVKALGLQRSPTNLVQVKFTQTSRSVAQEFVQAIMDRYLEQSLSWQSLRASRSAEFLTEQIEDVRSRLQDDEDSLREFSEEEKASGLEFQARVTVEESARLRAEASKLDMKLDIVDAASKRIRTRLKSGGMASLTATFFEDPVLLESVGHLTAKETRRELLRATYNDTHPLVLTLNREIEEEKRTVLKLLATSRRNLKSQQRELKRSIDKLESHLTGFPHKELELARRTRDLEVSQRLYSFLLEKKHEAEILKASTTTDKRIIDNASYPIKAHRPKRVKIVFSGLMGGLILGVLAAFQLRFFRRRIESVERIKDFLDFPVYGTIPALDDVKKTKKNDNNGRRHHVNPDSLWTDRQTPITEAIRSLCVNVGMIPKTSGRGRVIQITSSESREGKSTVLSNLAVSLRRGGASVLVIDLDLRKPTQHRIWSCPRNPGYTDLLADGHEAHGEADYLQTVGKNEIKLLSAGSKAPETMTALMHPSLPKIIESFAKQYEYVLIDSPPIFVADSSLISKFADLLLVVARPGLVERSSLMMSAHVTSRCDLPKGLVFNAVESKHHDSQYYSSNYGYGYGNGYAYTDYSYRSYESEPEQEAA